MKLTKTLHILSLIIGIGTQTYNAQSTVTGSFVHGGLTRDYRIYIPAAYTAGNPVPVVFNLHGYGSNMLEQEQYGDFRAIADTANFIIIHPNGTPDGSAELNWNSFGLTTVDDVGFLSRLLDTVMANYSVNPNRVYSTGMSNGGFMSYHLACNLSNRITAVASVTGSMTTGNMNACSPSHPTPIMQIHGTSDGTVPYLGNAYFVAIETLVLNWVAENNCSTTPVTVNVPNTNTTDGCTATQYIYSGGTNGATVEFFKVTGGAHTWPGAPIAIGVTNMDFSASKEIWRFFSQFTLSQLLSNDELDKEELFTVFPNPSNGLVNLSFNDFAPKEVFVYNNLGQQLVSISSSDVNVSLNLGQNKGVFLVVVKTKNSHVTQKLVVE
jgi:polyhydroxybutyrate depolymerase